MCCAGNCDVARDVEENFGIARVAFASDQPQLSEPGESDLKRNDNPVPKLSHNLEAKQSPLPCAEAVGIQVELNCGSIIYHHSPNEAPRMEPKAKNLV